MALVINPENNLYLKELVEKGKREGMIEGIRKGIEKGIEKGMLEAKKGDARRLYFKLKLSAEQIAEVLDIPLELVKEAIEE